MADINIERKGKSVLPWIVGILLLAVIAFAVWKYALQKDAAVVTPVETAPPAVTTTQ